MPTRRDLLVTGGLLAGAGCLSDAGTGDGDGDGGAGPSISSPAFTAGTFRTAVEPHVRGEATITGTYER